MMAVAWGFSVSTRGQEEPEVEPLTLEFINDRSTDWVTNKLLKLDFTKGTSAGQAQVTVQYYRTYFICVVLCMFAAAYRKKS